MLNLIEKSTSCLFHHNVIITFAAINKYVTIFYHRFYHTYLINNFEYPWKENLLEFRCRHQCMTLSFERRSFCNAFTLVCIVSILQQSPSRVMIYTPLCPPQLLHVQKYNYLLHHLIHCHLSNNLILQNMTIMDFGHPKYHERVHLPLPQILSHHQNLKDKKNVIRGG